ncbi:C40 family peptidase [Streptomyces sp. J2-1]|uniref:C40 family peptidase n=1 Tax=Streptomyces corallincola TaxID=2851888 RepID=UPI001C394ACC|nr:C40 family peptidase [Streptomyces corallincola]MBV2353241.1 C40 family peptidase [Streptomyces corallincola]
MSGVLRRLACTAVVAAQAVLLPVAPAGAAPTPDRPVADRPVSELLTDLQRLYRQTEQATESYNAAAERLAAQQAVVARLDGELARVRLALRGSRIDAGRLARRQYQSGTDFSPYVRLLLARDPQHMLDEGHVIGQLARERQAAVTRLAGAERKQDALAKRARAALDTRLTLAGQQRGRRDDVTGRLKDVERMLASLTPDQLAALARLERDETDRAQRDLTDSGALGDDKPPSGEGDRAVRYALEQIGKPYRWGARGPGSYDCSGLTSEAWRHAGTPIPRTSQEQWARLARVPLHDLRPGDLVVYFADATHVAMYLGEGKVVQAPRPGDTVRVSPLAANPVLGAVRPDAPRPGTLRFAVPGAAPSAPATPPHGNSG